MVADRIIGSDQFPLQAIATLQAIADVQEHANP